MACTLQAPGEGVAREGGLNYIYIRSSLVPNRHWLSQFFAPSSLSIQPPVPLHPYWKVQ